MNFSKTIEDEIACVITNAVNNDKSFTEEYLDGYWDRLTMRYKHLIDLIVEERPLNEINSEVWRNSLIKIIKKEIRIKE